MNGRCLSWIARVATTAACALSSLALSSLLGFGDDARAEKRAALIIGNSSYQNVVRLDNPSHDAAAIADMFRKAGFDSVELKLDLGVIEFKRALRDFYNTTREAEIAVVYYAGHGIEVGGVNYMIPIDAKLRSDYDAEDEAVALERIFRSIESTRRLRLVILDACRDNPFIRSMQRQVATRAVGQGLAKVEPTGSDTLVAFAAKAGSTAEDGSGRNSPYTQALVNNLTIPGLDIRLALGRVRDEVLRKTANRQEPFMYGSLGGATIALVPAPEKKEPSITDMRADYEIAERVGTVSAWNSFLALHGTGFYADLAKQQRDKLAGAAVRDKPADPQMTVAALDRSTPGTRPPAEADRAGPDALAWDKVKDSSDAAAIRAFIKRFPTSPLAVVAQNRLDVIERALADRQREVAERDRLAREAALRREEDERRAKAAEAERQRAEREAARAREEEEKRVKAAEAERQRIAREAARLREEEEKRAKAAEIERQKAEREAARASEEQERRAKAAAAAAEKAQRDAEIRAAKAAEAERLEAERNVARLRAEEDKRVKAAAEQAARLEREAAAAAEKAEREAALAAEKVQREAAAAAEKAKREEEKLQREAALRIEREKAEQAFASAPANAPLLVKAAQSELRRIGCFSGEDTGTIDEATRRAIEANRINAGQGRGGEISVTPDMVLGLKQQKPVRNCLAALDTDVKTQDADERAGRKPAATERPAREKRETARPAPREREAARPAPREREAARPAPPRREAAPARAQATAARPIPRAGGGAVMHGIGF